MADEALTAGAVARRLGVAVTTLRTWHQRYGLGPSHHVPGQHRRYTPEDMDRLQVMRRLTAQGVAPAEAAAWARRVPVPIDVSTPLTAAFPAGPGAVVEGNPAGSAASVTDQPREGPPEALLFDELAERDSADGSPSPVDSSSNATGSARTARLDPDDPSAAGRQGAGILSTDGRSSDSSGSHAGGRSGLPAGPRAAQKSRGPDSPIPGPQPTHALSEGGVAKPGADDSLTPRDDRKGSSSARPASGSGRDSSSAGQQPTSPWHGLRGAGQDQAAGDGPAASATPASDGGNGPVERDTRRPGRWHTSDPDRPDSDTSHPSGDEVGDPRPGTRPDATFSRLGERPPTIDAVWPERTGRMFVARDGGGHAIRTGRAGPAARGLARAAMRLDGPALRDILEMTITDRGVIGAWEEVIMPVLIGVGERYAATKRFIEVEHILSRGVTEVLSSVTRPPSSQIPRVLLAAADEEQHTLPLEALAAALAQAGVSSRLLGARVPAQAVAEAIARTGPDVLVLWSQLPGSADPAQWRHVLSGRHRPLLVSAAGPGWLPDQLPEEVTLLGSLAEAVQLVSAIVLPPTRPH